MFPLDQLISEGEWHECKIYDNETKPGNPVFPGTELAVDAGQYFISRSPSTGKKS